MKKTKWLFLLLFLILAGAANAQTVGVPCAPSGNVGFEIPNIGNTTNWGNCLNYDLTYLDALLGGVSPLQLGATTPPVYANTNWITANTSPVTITNFLSGFPGQSIRIFCGSTDTFTNISSNANIGLNSSWTCASSTSISLTLINGKWIESGRGGGGSGGSGTVTSVSLSNFSPLFNVSVSSPTLTPSFTFNALNAAPNTVFGNCTSGSAVPNFCSLTTAMIPTIPLATGVSGTLPHASLPTLLAADIPNNNANTTGNAATATTLTGPLSHSLLPTLLSGDIPNNSANTTGNANTASALASTPTLCGSTQAAIGILANGNATGCWTPGSGITLQTNTVNNASQTLFNLVNSAATNGLTLTATNTGTGVVQLGFSGTLSDAGLANAYSGVGTCSSGQYATAFTRNTAPGCAQVAYGQLSGTPTLFYQTVGANGSSQTQRPRVNLINGTNMTISCVDNAGTTSSDCTFTASTTASVAFSALTAGSNSQAGTFSATGNSWDFGAALSLKVPVSAGAIPTVNGLIAYDSTANKYVFGQNGLTVSLGVASSSGCPANQFVNTPATGTAAAACAQVAFSNLSGVATAAQLPNPGASSLGGVQSFAPVLHQFLTSISTGGVVSAGQPSLSDLSAGTASAVMNFPGGDLLNGSWNDQTGTTYPFAVTDIGGLTTFCNSGAIAVSLSQVNTGGFTTGGELRVYNRCAGTVTITPTVSTINGQTTLVLNSGQGATIKIGASQYGAQITAAPTGGGTVTSVGMQVNSGSSSGIFGVLGSPVTTSGNLNLTLAGTTGGIPYFSTSSVLSTSGALALNGVVIGGGVSGAPSTTASSSTPTNVLFATAPGAPAFRDIGTSDTSVKWYAADTGAANAYLLAPTPAITALTVGTQVTFTTTHPNSGGSTVNVNSTGLKNLTKLGTTALSSGDILTGANYVIEYDGTQWQLLNPSSNQGTVTSVNATFTGGLVSLSGGPITGSGVLAFTVAGTSGGIPYFSSASTWGTSAALTSGQFVLGGGAGSPPATSFSIVPFTNGGLGTNTNPAAHQFFGNNSGSATAPAFGLIGASDVFPNNYAVATGSVNALVASYTPAVTALTVGLEIDVLPNLANTTTTPTINVQALGAKTITKNGTAALANGDLSTTAVAKLIYDGTGFQLQNPQSNPGGTVTSVAQSFTGGLISVSGSPITNSGTLALTVAGTSGGIPYFASGITWASSAALTAHGIVIGGGAGVAPTSSTAGVAGQLMTSNGPGVDPTFQNAPGGTGTVTNTGGTLTLGRIILGNGSSDVKPDTSFDDGVTAANTLTYTGTGGIVAPGFTASGTGGLVITFAETTAPTGLAASDIIYGNSSDHTFHVNMNNAGDVKLITSANNVGALATTTSSVFLGTISDEVGTGFVMGNNSPTIITPTIASFTNATHNHQSAAGGGTLDAAAIASGALVKARQTASTVYNDQTNTGTTAFTLDLSASTSAAAFRLPNLAGASSVTSGAVSYDTTNKNIHMGANGVDNINAIIPSSISPANNDCVKWTLATGVLTLNTQGGPCGGLPDPGGNGIVVRTALNTVTNRSIAVSGPVTISNADGTAGNPTVGATINLCTSYFAAGAFGPTYASSTSLCPAQGTLTLAAAQAMSTTNTSIVSTNPAAVFQRTTSGNDGFDLSGTFDQLAQLTIDGNAGTANPLAKMTGTLGFIEKSIFQNATNSGAGRLQIFGGTANRALWNYFPSLNDIGIEVEDSAAQLETVVIGNYGATTGTNGNTALIQTKTQNTGFYGGVIAFNGCVAGTTSGNGYCYKAAQNSGSGPWGWHWIGNDAQTAASGSPNNLTQLFGLKYGSYGDNSLINNAASAATQGLGNLGDIFSSSVHDSQAVTTHNDNFCWQYIDDARMIIHGMVSDGCGDTSHAGHVYTNASATGVGLTLFTGNLAYLPNNGAGTAFQIKSTQNTVAVNDMAVLGNLGIGQGTASGTGLSFAISAGGTMANPFIMGNSFVDFATGINIGSGVTNAVIGPNNFDAVTTLYSDSGTNTALLTPMNNLTQSLIATRTTLINATTIATTTANSTWEVKIALGCTTSTASATATPSIIYTDASNTVVTVAGTAATCTTLTGAGPQDTSQTLLIRVKAATNIQYSVAVANAPSYQGSVIAYQLTTQ